MLIINTNTARTIFKVGTQTDLQTAVNKINTAIDSTMMLPHKYFLQDCTLCIQPDNFVFPYIVRACTLLNRIHKI